QAGLLDGRAATTYWRYSAELTRRFPAVDLQPDVLYVQDGQILTSAGPPAGMALCPHMIRTAPRRRCGQRPRPPRHRARRAGHRPLAGRGLALGSAATPAVGGPWWCCGRG